MKFAAIQSCDVKTLAAAIARSQIMVTRMADSPSWRLRQLPGGYDDIDLAVLEWIAAEGRRAGRSFVRM